MLIAGSKGERIRRPRKSRLERVLDKNKDEIIGYAIDQWEKYDPEWLSYEVLEIWWEEFDEAGLDPTAEEIELIVAKWDKEIADEIKLSFEPTALEEAKCDIINETMKGLK